MIKFFPLLILILLAPFSAFAAPDFYLRGHDGEWWEVRDQYKFQQNGDVYTLHVDQLASNYPFKVATSDFSIQYGSSDTFAYDKPLACINAVENNIAISPNRDVTIAGATLTLDRTNPDAVTLTVTPDLYLAGESNSWNNRDAATRFSYHDGVYTLALRELTGSFRIAAGVSPAWTVEYGGRKNMKFDHEYPCITGPGNDMTMEQRFENVVITFNKEAKTIKVSDNNANYSGEEFYLRGHDGNWDARDSYKFQCHGSVYTLHVHFMWQNQTFKIANRDYSLQFGTTETFAYDKPMTCVNAYGNNFQIPGRDGILRGATLIFDYGNRTAPTLRVVPDPYLVGNISDWVNAVPTYRFENRHGIYYLYMEKLYGDFKIAAGSTPDWIWEFGGQQNMSLGNTYSLKSGSGNNMSVSGAPLNNVTLVFDNINKTLTLKPIQIDLEDRELHLAGSFNGWNGSDPNYKFTKNGDCYTLRVPRLYGEFKVVTSDWTYQFGSYNSIPLFQPTSCVVAFNGCNMGLADGVQTDAEIKFYPSTMTIEISGPPTLYLTGDFNNWCTSPLYAFDFKDNKYVLETHDFTGNFKIVSNDHLLQLGKAENDIDMMGVEYAIQQVGHSGGHLNFRGTGAINPSQRIRLTLDPTGTSNAIDNIIDIDNDAQPEYFNLQGIRVTHPANGIYIRRRGNVIDKIFIR